MLRVMRRGLLLHAALALAAASGAAHAQTPEGAREGAVVYGPTFFEPFAPQTALDMVRRVPGFAISEGEERRGLSGAAGNVLIDGAAPVVKSQDLEDLLERIPAGDVVRIELLRGASANASSAQSVRLNVVRRPSDGDGIWQAGLERAEDGRVSLSGQLSWSGRRRAVQYAFSAMFEDAHAPIQGDVRGVDPLGAPDERESERITETEHERRLSGELTTPFASGALVLNVTLSREEGRERQTVSVFDAVGAFDGSDHVDAQEREDIAEVGATYTRILGTWEAEFSALLTRRRLSDDEYAEERSAGGAFDEAEREARDVDAGETILRGNAGRDLTGGATLSLGAEAAFNTLDQTLELTEDEGLGPVPIDVPAANVGIEEARAEAFATLAWRASPRWRFEASTAVETSSLRQSGDVSLETNLTYWKPSLQAVRAFGDDDQVRFRIYRDVGQLDFEDFAASAELSGSDVFAGNADLRPETSWRAEAAVDWRFEHGALEVTLFHWRIEDALDFVPIGLPGDQFDARGNIGDATLSGARIAFEAPLPLLRDARLRVEGLWQESEATDPLTGESRPQSEIQESTLLVEFRQDVRALDLAWGIDFERERLAPEFRLDRVAQEDEADDVEIWLETTRFAGVKLRVFAANLVNARDARDRTFFDPDRTGAFNGEDHRERELGNVFGIELQGAF